MKERTDGKRLIDVLLKKHLKIKKKKNLQMLGGSLFQSLGKIAEEALSTMCKELKWKKGVKCLSEESFECKSLIKSIMYIKAGKFCFL